MKFIKKIINVFSVILIVSMTVKTPNDDMQKIKSFKKEMIKAILPILEDDSGYNKTSKVEIIAIPTCTLALNDRKKGLLENLNRIAIDTTLQYAVVKNNDIVKAIVSKNNNSPYDVIHHDNQRFDYENKQIKMILFALKYSADPFFVYFFDNEKALRNLIGYFEDGKIYFIDENLNVYRNTPAIVNVKYGSMEKYFEMTSDLNFKKQLLLKIDRVNDLKNVLKSDYSVWQTYFPKDTSKILQVFLTELSQNSDVSKEQQTLLKEAILNRIQLFKIETYSCGISFLGQDVSNEVKAILTRNQYNKYIEKREYASWLSFQANEKMFNYLKKIKEISEDSIPNYYRNEILANNL